MLMAKWYNIMEESFFKVANSCYQMADNKRFITNETTRDICHDGHTYGLGINMVGRQNTGTSRRDGDNMTNMAGILSFVVIFLS